MPLSNSNNINILATKLDNIDLTKSLKWSLIPKDEIGDDIISLEPQVISANSSSGCASATLDDGKYNESTSSMFNIRSIESIRARSQTFYVESIRTHSSHYSKYRHGNI